MAGCYESNTQGSKSITIAVREESCISGTDAYNEPKIYASSQDCQTGYGLLPKQCRASRKCSDRGAWYANVPKAPAAGRLTTIMEAGGPEAAVWQITCITFEA